jgi:hypothetical protein
MKRGSTHLWNISLLLRNYMASYPRKLSHHTHHHQHLKSVLGCNLSELFIVCSSICGQSKHKDVIFTLRSILEHYLTLSYYLACQTDFVHECYDFPVSDEVTHFCDIGIAQWLAFQKTSVLRDISVKKRSWVCYDFLRKTFSVKKTAIWKKKLRQCKVSYNSYHKFNNGNSAKTNWW